jgi:hypothetical protein
MPAPRAGERTNLRGGRARAAAADMFLLLQVPSLGAWLASYTRVGMPRPLYLAAALGEPPLPLEALATAERRAVTRWLLERLPQGEQLPPRALGRVLDDGRAEFTLSRTRHNWRRLIAGRAWVAGTLGAAFWHVCAWDNVWHSGGVVATVVLLGFFPAQVRGGWRAAASFAFACGVCARACDLAGGWAVGRVWPVDSGRRAMCPASDHAPPPRLPPQPTTLGAGAGSAPFGHGGAAVAPPRLGPAPAAAAGHGV